MKGMKRMKDIISDLRKRGYKLCEIDFSVDPPIVLTEPIIAPDPADNTGYKWTVWCNTNKKFTKHFIDRGEAVDYCNHLLRSWEQAVLRPYKPPKSYIDHLIDRESGNVSNGR